MWLFIVAIITEIVLLSFCTLIEMQQNKDETLLNQTNLHPVVKMHTQSSKTACLLSVTSALFWFVCVQEPAISTQHGRNKTKQKKNYKCICLRNYENTIDLCSVFFHQSSALNKVTRLNKMKHHIRSDQIKRIYTYSCRIYFFLSAAELHGPFFSWRGVGGMGGETNTFISLIHSYTTGCESIYKLEHHVNAM